MKGLLIGLVLVVLVIGGFYVFSGDNAVVDSDHGDNHEAVSGDSVDSADEPATTSTDSSGATTHNVVIDNFKLPSLTVKVGDTVSWTNEDGAPHTATANGGSFDTDRLETGESGSFTFTSAGEFDYFCAIHPSMKGKVIVE
jgi:plastocyanin